MGKKCLKVSGRIVLFSPFLSGLTVLILFSLVSISAFPSAADNTFIFLSSGDVITFDPGYVTDSYSSRVISNIYEGLTRYKRESLDIEPCLAESWELKDDGKKWIFNIRKNVKFHNGKILDASDVVRSFSSRMGDKERYRDWNLFYNYIVRVRETGKHRVEFMLSEPYAPFLFQLASPKSSITSPSMSGDGPAFSGTGPFRFAGRREGKFVKLEKYDSYWGKPASLSSVIFKVVPDPKWRILQVQNGTADAATLDPGRMYNESFSSRKVKVISAPSASVHFLAFNLTRGPFRDRRLREALARTINKKAVIRNIFQGYAENAATPVPPGIFGHNPGIRDLKLDLQKARELKEESDVSKVVEVSLYYSNNFRDLDAVAGLLQRVAKNIGIKINRRPVPFSELVNLGYDQYDMLMMGWIGDIPEADVFLYPNFSGKSGRLNASGYANPEMTELLDKARKTNDPSLREKMYMQAQEIIRRDLPWIPLFHMNEMLICSKSVRNITIQPLSFLNFREVYFGGK